MHAPDFSAAASFIILAVAVVAPGRVDLPLAIDSDPMAGMMDLHHGLTGNAEIYAHCGYLHYNPRSSDVMGIHGNSARHWADTWADNYQFKKDDDTPVLLGFVEVALFEKLRESHASFKFTLCHLYGMGSSYFR